MAIQFKQSNKQKTASEFQNSHAFIVGINGYRNGVPALRSAENDARRLADMLEEQHGYVAHLFVEEVTRETLEQLFAETMPARVGEHDRVLLYFAGHGIALEGEDGPQGYLLPQDAKPEDSETLLAMSEINGWLEKLTCRHMLVILDCCFAGTFRWASTRDVNRLPSVIYKEVYERFVREHAWQVLTSTAYDQKALDTVAGQVIGVREQMEEAAQQLHSPFALALFDALTGSADVIPINGGDGIITATELFMFMRDQVVNGVADYHNQTPGLWPLRREYDKGEFIFLDPNGTLQLEPAPPLTFENNPYRGLKSYDAKHETLFFGRDELIIQLAEQVDRSSFTAVLGASGTGKSSLVKAGLLPYLRKTGYHTLDPVRPAANPRQALDAALRSGLTFEETVPSSASLRGLLARWQQRNPDKKLLLIIDQFEELITQCRHESERDAFLAELVQLIGDYADFLHVVVTLRSDFESHFAGSQSEIATLWTDDMRFIVPPMSQTELREVIVRPAAERALYFEPGELVDELISAVSQTPGALPLLSFTLSELYIRYIKSQRGDRALHKDDYDALGGVVGALRFRAEEEYGELSADQQKTLQRIMLRMIALEGDGMTRRRVMRQELEYRDEEENERVNKILARLENARLIVADADRDGNRYVEPAHDSLVSSWGMLHQWRMNAAEYLPLQRRVALSAEDWHNEPDNTQKAGLLWHDDSRLPTVAGLLPPSINDNATPLRQFSDRAVQIVDRLRVASAPPTDERWLNALETDFTWQSVQRRWRNTRRLWGGVLTAFAIVAMLALIANSLRITANENEATAFAESTRAIQQQHIAETQRDIAQARLHIAQGRAIFETEPLISLALLLEGVSLVQHQSEEVQFSILADNIDYVFKSGRIFADEYSSFSFLFRNNSILEITRGDKSLVELRDTVSGSLIFKFENDAFIYNLNANNSDSPIVLDYYNDSEKDELWNLDDGSITTLEWEVESVFDEKNIIIIDYLEGRGEVRNTEGSVVTTLNGEISSIRGTDFVATSNPFSFFSTDAVNWGGELPSPYFVVTYEDGEVELRDANNGDKVSDLDGVPVAFSPDYSALIVAHDGAAPQLIHTKTDEVVADFGQDTPEINDIQLGDLRVVAFSPDENASLFYIGVWKYPDEVAQLRRTKDGRLVSAPNKNVDWIKYNSDRNAQYFVVRYIDGSSDLHYINGDFISHLPDDVQAAVFSDSAVEVRLAVTLPNNRIELYNVPDTSQFISLSDAEGFPSFSPDTEAALLIVPEVDPFHTNEVDYRVYSTSDGDLFNDMGLLDNAFVCPNGMILLADHFNSSGELIQSNNGKTLGILADKVRNAWFSPNCDVLVVDYHSKPDEMLRASDATVIRLLQENVESVHFGYETDQSFIAINYLGHAEFRLSSDGSVFHSFPDNVTSIEFSPDEEASYFVVSFSAASSEIWSSSNLARLTSLEANDPRLSFHFDPDRLIVLYWDGRDHILDLELLRAMSEYQDVISVDELKGLICEYPLRNGLSHEQESKLAEYFPDREPPLFRACDGYSSQ